MDELACPRCKTTKYRNPALKLLVNVCGHALCENCVELLFVRGSGSCPECGVALRRNNFRLRLFEDAGVEKEMDIRKRILKDFNKKEEEFATLREYNDYLEEIETIVFNLTNGVDVEETKRLVEQYKKDNKEQIRKNLGKLSKDEELLEELIEHEHQEAELHRQQALQEEQQQKREKRKNKEALIDELMFSDLPADHIMASKKKEIEMQQEQKASQRAKATTFSTGLKVGQHQRDAFWPIPPTEEVPVYSYISPAYDLMGPELPECMELETEGYLKHIRIATDSELAGGYKAIFGCHRALQDAFAGLLFSPTEMFAHKQSGETTMEVS